MEWINRGEYRYSLMRESPGSLALALLHQTLPSSCFSILRISGERRKWRKGKQCLQNTNYYIGDFPWIERLILCSSEASPRTSSQTLLLASEILGKIFIT